LANDGGGGKNALNDARNPKLEMEQSQMNTQQLMATARALVADDKGLLAMDESNPTCNKRFAKLGIPQTVEARRAYRELILTTSNLGECISGVILYDETLRQRKKDGTSFVKVITDAGIIPGIKVDTGAKDMAGHPKEKITEGLDGLRGRLAEYYYEFSIWPYSFNLPRISCCRYDSWLFRVFHFEKKLEIQKIRSHGHL
jgi:hypothetical protein